jgi:hypothetical protein
MVKANTLQMIKLLGWVYLASFLIILPFVFGYASRSENPAAGRLKEKGS